MRLGSSRIRTRNGATTGSRSTSLYFERGDIRRPEADGGTTNATTISSATTSISTKPRLENSSVDSKSNAHVDPTITATGGAVTSSVTTASILLSTENDVAVPSPPTSLPHITTHGSDVDNSATTTTSTSDNNNNIPSSNRKQNVNSISDPHNHEDLSTVYDGSRPFVSFDDNATTDTSTIVFDLD